MFMLEQGLLSLSKYGQYFIFASNNWKNVLEKMVDWELLCYYSNYSFIDSWFYTAANVREVILNKNIGV